MNTTRPKEDIPDFEVLSSLSKVQFIGAIVLATIWNFIILMSLITNLMTQSFSIPIVILLSLAQLLGFILIGRAAVLFLKSKKHAKSYLHFKKAVMGETFTAFIETPINPYLEGHPYIFTLSASSYSLKSNGSEYRSSESCTWTETIRVVPDSIEELDGHYRIPLSFEIPNNETVWGTDTWRLKGNCNTVGLNWSEEFLLPVTVNYDGLPCE